MSLASLEELSLGPIEPVERESVCRRSAVRLTAARGVVGSASPCAAFGT